MGSSTHGSRSSPAKEPSYEVRNPDRHRTGAVSGPDGIAVDGEGNNIWVADTGNDRVQEFTSAGHWLAKFGRTETEGPQLASPTGISANAAGTVVVAEPADDKVQSWVAVAGQPLPPIEPAPTVELEASSAGPIESA